MNRILASIFFTTLSSVAALSQVAEQQVSFAQESRPHTYYVQQAELWSKELAQDSTSEDAWYNYFRACRNAHGTADWRSDFVSESPALMEGGEIVKQMQRAIPGTFTAHYTAYLTNGIGTDNAEDLFKAYEMDPNFPGIHSSVISYAESSLDRSLRKRTNQEWYRTNYLSSQLLTYSYNLLMSLEPNAILFVQADNDSYPTWMLQDALGIRTDVHVVNIDFLLLDDYRDAVYRGMGLPTLDLGEIILDEYRQNWRKVVEHIVDHHDGSRPIYFSMTLFGELYERYQEQLAVSGLALRYAKEPLDLEAFNQHLYTDVFLLDSLRQNLGYDRNQRNMDIQNTNYMSWLMELYNHYRSEDNANTSRDAVAQANKVRDLALMVARRYDAGEFANRIEGEFR